MRQWSQPRGNRCLAGFCLIVLSCAQGAWSRRPYPPDADVRTIAADGEDLVDLVPHLAPGKVTVFDFYADWCDPCFALDEHMKEVLARRKDVAYRRLDMRDWDSPLARRWLAHAPALPYVIVYDAAGTRTAVLAGFSQAALDAAIDGKPSRGAW